MPEPSPTTQHHANATAHNNRKRASNDFFYTSALLEDVLLKPEKAGMLLFASDNYKTNLHIDIKFHELTKVKSLSDKSADPNLLSKLVVHPTWTLQIMCQNTFTLGSANEHPISLKKVILQHRKMGKIRIRILSNVLDR